MNTATGRVRIAVVVALGAALLWVLIGQLRGGDEYEVTAEFENASQLVPGNQVVVGGVSVGSVKEIDLAPNGHAIVRFTVEGDYAPLRRGTTATVRWPTLSSIAGRQVQLTIPPDSETGPEIEDGGTIGEQDTVSAVDIDHIFNTLTPRTIRDLKHVIEGFALGYEGVGERANRGYRYLNPLLSTTRRVFGELTADERALEQLVVDTSQLSGALAARAPDVSALVGNVNEALNAIGDRKQQLTEAISLLPGFMRRANTTYVNLRATLGDLDPLVDASGPAIEQLGPFLSELRGAARDSVPAIAGLDRVIAHPGSDNDLVELTAAQPALARLAIGSGAPDCGPGAEDPADLQFAADGDFSQGAFGESVCSLANSLGTLSFFRAYSSELGGWFHTFSKPGIPDGIGGFARVAATFNAFSPSFPFAPNASSLLSPDESLALMNTGDVQRCPGAAERLLSGEGSAAFTDGGALTDGSHANGECDPTQGTPAP